MKIQVNRLEFSLVPLKPPFFGDKKSIFTSENHYLVPGPWQIWAMKGPIICPNFFWPIVSYKDPSLAASASMAALSSKKTEIDKTYIEISNGQKFKLLLLK